VPVQRENDQTLFFRQKTAFFGNDAPAALRGVEKVFRHRNTRDPQAGQPAPLSVGRWAVRDAQHLADTQEIRVRHHLPVDLPDPLPLVQVVEVPPGKQGQGLARRYDVCPYLLGRGTIRANQ
jgi:hypothetical protein